MITHSIMSTIDQITTTTTATTNGISSNKNDDDDDDSDGGTSERQLLVFQAQLCEQSGRFDEMVAIMKTLCTNYNDLTIDERDLLSCSYKNVIGSRRTSWRILNEILTNLNNDSTSANNNNNSNEQRNKEQLSPSPPTIILNKQQHQEETNKYSRTIVRSFLDQIESELRLHCSNIIDILSQQLIPSNSATGESRVFYYKMKADYLRYLCEISSPPEKKEISNESLLSYKTASEKAMVDLPPTHPVRLGLMLNFSVFYYDIMKSPERSCRLAKQAFDDAIAELDTLSEVSYRDSTIIMQLLRDNLNLWQSEQSIQATNEQANYT